ALDRSAVALDDRIESVTKVHQLAGEALRIVPASCIADCHAAAEDSHLPALRRTDPLADPTDRKVLETGASTCPRGLHAPLPAILRGIWHRTSPTPGQK